MILENPTQIQVSAIIKFIKKRRKKRGISQNEMAIRLCITQNSYFKIEKEKTKLDLYRFIQISQILEFNISELFLKYEYSDIPKKS